MNQNSLIEIGSKASVILRFKSKININGETYIENEPYLFLENCNVLVNYSNEDRTWETTKTLIAHSDIKPRTIQIGGISFSRKLASLLATYEEGDFNYRTTQFKELIAEDNLIFLTEEVNPKAMFVYNTDYERIDFEYREDMNAIFSESFEDGSVYLVSYFSLNSGTKFNLIKPHIPYMSLEIQGVGNIDKKTKNILMYFDKVSLNSMLHFTFMQGDMINSPLEFYIIDDKKNYVVFEG